MFEADSTSKTNGLSERKRQLESILNAITDVVFSLRVEPGPRYVFESVNPAFLTVTGLSELQIMGMSVEEVIPEPSRRLVLEKYAEAIRERRLVRWEETSDYPTGRLTGEVSVMPIFDEAGRCTSLVGSVHDVTAYKTALRSRDAFMAMASHELKTPLAAMALQADNRLRKLKRGDLSSFTPEKLSEIFEFDKRQVARLNRLIDEMLDMSRIRAGILAIQREPADLVTIARDSVRSLDFVLESFGCDVTIAGDDSVQGTWDRFRLEQIFINFLTNAAKFGAGRPIRITITGTYTHAQIRVQDQGIGIDRRDHARIFRQFERADSASRIEGLGLGLFIVRQVVEAHGGEIELESAPGEGATFIVRLPRSEQSAQHE